MDKETAVKRTETMWNGLADHPEMSKIDWLTTEKSADWEWPREPWLCYLCDIFWNSDNRCQGCPLDTEVNCGLYFDWLNAIGGLRKRSRIARKIAALCHNWLEAREEE